MIVAHLPFLSRWYGQLSVYSFAKLFIFRQLVFSVFSCIFADLPADQAATTDL